jgi:hypothetical protein
LSGCQVQYNYKNGNCHVDNACSIFFGSRWLRLWFKTTQLMTKTTNDKTNIYILRRVYVINAGTRATIS